MCTYSISTEYYIQCSGRVNLQLCAIDIIITICIDDWCPCLPCLVSVASAVTLKALESKKTLLKCTVHPCRSNGEESFDEPKMAASPRDNQSGVRVLGKLLKWQSYNCTEKVKTKAKSSCYTRSQRELIKQLIYIM